MGGRGASSGISDKGKKYGTEYKTVLKVSNIKFIDQIEQKSVKAPQETMTKGRVYVTLDRVRKIPTTITYYSDNGERKKSIDLNHKHKKIKGLHAHEGYDHAENGTHKLSLKEKAMVDLVYKVWHNKFSR